jgi:hypothetical protein
MSGRRPPAQEREIIMSSTLHLTLQQKVLKNETTVVGFTQYEGGEIHEGNRCVGAFVVVRETIAGVTDLQNLDTSMETMTLFFFTQQSGGGGGHTRGQAPENITLQGANEFAGSPNVPPTQERQTVNSMGSVSAASHAWAQLIGKPFVRRGHQLTIG